MDGAAASLNSVANFITALKRSGYFQKVEIKEAKQDEKNQNVQTFMFSINAEIAPNGPAAATSAAKPASAPGGTGPTASAPAKKG
jgi:Tfp pilus assembly protein PilN